MLRQGNVKLIGEPFPELALGPSPGGPTSQGPPPGAIAQPGPQGFLDAQLLDPTAGFARIYGFSFEGHYYDLPRPVIMLVHGPGIPVAGGAGSPPAPPILDSDEAARVWEFSSGLLQWNYDKTTVSIRLDLDSGPLQDILLARALGERASASGSGAYGSGAYGSGAYGSGAYGRGRRGGCD
jgi:hypothetical protein